MKHSGFTIVELIIVVAVIGILATVTLVSYRSVQQSASLAKVQTDLAAINDGIKIYQAKKGRYPVNGLSWTYSCQDPNGFKALVGEYIDNVPAAPCKGPGGTDDSWMYMSSNDGSNYKLIHNNPTSIVRIKDQIPSELRDQGSVSGPARFTVNGTWGFWTDGYKNW